MWAQLIALALIPIPIPMIKVGCQLLDHVQRALARAGAGNAFEIWDMSP